MVAMDRGNLRDLRRMKSGEGEGVGLWGGWDLGFDREGNGGGGGVDEGEEVGDPYYGGEEGFEVAYRQCVRFSRGWVKRVLGVDVDVDDGGKVTVGGD